jgi:hypothetical protein
MFQQTVVPVSHEVDFVGKRIKTSKLRHLWSFYVRRNDAVDPAVDNYFEVELLFSKKSSKRRVSVNGHLMKQVAGKVDENVKFCISGLVLEVKPEVRSGYDLLIGGESFSQLNPDHKLDEEEHSREEAQPARPNKAVAVSKRQRGSYPRSLSDHEAVEVLESLKAKATLTLVSKAPIVQLQRKFSANQPTEQDDSGDMSRVSNCTASTISPAESFKDPFATPSSMVFSPFTTIPATAASTTLTAAASGRGSASVYLESDSVPDFLSGSDNDTNARDSFVDPFSSVLSSASLAPVSVPPPCGAPAATATPPAPAAVAQQHLNPFDVDPQPTQTQMRVNTARAHKNPFDDEVAQPEMVPATEAEKLRAENETLRLRVENEALKARVQAQQHAQQAQHQHAHQHHQHHQQAPQPVQFDLVEYQKQCQQQQYQMQQQQARWSMECHRHSYEQQLYHHQLFHHQQHQHQQRASSDVVSVQQLSALVGNQTFDSAVMLALNAPPRRSGVAVCAASRTLLQPTSKKSTL